MYDFYIDSLMLPYAPEKLAVSIDGANKTVDLINIGQVNILKNPKLTDIEFEFTIPDTKYPYVKEFKEQNVYLSKLEELITSKKPFRFIVSRAKSQGSFLDDTNMLVSLENYKIIEDAKAGFDIVISVKLKQYKEYGTKKVTITQDKKKTDNKKISVKSKNIRTAKVPIKTYTVKQGDTLWAICKKQLGDGEKYKEVAKKNNISNPNIIRAGQIIKF
ncbi:MAG: LysM peptidoglycan-binding domain-containing protein [Peptoanaerobacter stomatis]|uniref:LysM peptidoglycan-binding domain-containing protein n=1 Tax=Peptoanaerobacter stomatis TaxID=796937 RepID=UPI003F9F8C8D